MLLRSVRCALAAAVATGSILFALPARGWAAEGTGPASIVLLGQSATVTPPSPGEPATFELTVEVDGDTAGTEIGLSFYDKLATSSGFQATLSGPPSGLLHTVSPEAVSGLKRVGSGVQLTSTVVVGDTPAPSGSATVNLDQCVAGSELCSGVYPVVVQLFDASGTVVSHLTTYLTYAEVKSASPLVFTWVVPFGAQVRIRQSGSLAQAIPALGAGRVKHLGELAEELAANPGVQVSVAPSPSTVERLERSTSPEARAALASLHAVGASGPHRLLYQPYVPINLSALAQAGVGAEIAGQVQRARDVMAPVSAKLSSTEAPSWQTWVATGQVGSAIAAGMSQVGAKDLVLPDSDLASATEEAHATWSQPFTLSVGRGGGITAAVSNSALSSLFTAEPADPVLAANQLLAELAFVQSELPGASSTRGVIAVAPPAWNPDPRFVDALVAGLANNPVVSTATLSGFFAVVQSGANGAAPTRRLADGPGAALISPTQAAAIVAARDRITGFAQAVQGHPAIENDLEDLLLTTESNQLTPAAQSIGREAFERQLTAALAGIQVVRSTVTLTARTASIPITIVSKAGFALRARLTLKSPKLQFPEGASRNVLIDHPTNSTQIEVRARTSGDLPLSFFLTSRDGRLVIARGQFTVRSTATSIVGIVLTLVAAVVLIGWWARTWARGRRDRRARAHRGAAP